MLPEYLPGDKLIAYPAREPLDSFGRMRISTPFNVFNAQFNYGLQPLLFESLTNNGSITHMPFSSSVRLSTEGSASGNNAIFQSKQHFRYNPDRAQQIIWTCVLGAKKNNVKQSIGYYDPEDGLGFLQDSSELNILRRSSTSGSPEDELVPQSLWNLDGLGHPDNEKNSSGVTLDVAKKNIFIIDFGWLGSGLIRWGFDFGGHTTYIHQMQFANTDIVPFMRTANLPFRVEIENTGIASGETIFDFNCVAINSEGGSEPVGIKGATNNGIATGGNTPLRAVTSSTDLLPILSIRPKTTFNSLTNRGQIRPISYRIASKDAPVYYSIVLNGTLTGELFNDVNTENSIVQVDTSATTLSGGTIVDCGYVGGVMGVQGLGITPLDLKNIVLSNNIIGDATDILTIAVGRADGVNSDCGAGFAWKELF